MPKTEILLESGTNELEILEFTVNNRHYGINVAKIVELMQYHEVTPMPNANPFVEGVFKPRDKLMTLINLPAYLGQPESEDVKSDIFIITHFNQVFSAFHVHSVVEIHRISWENIEKPDPAIYGSQDGLATGIARVGKKLITIIDFEKILQDINPLSGIQMDTLSQLGERNTSDKPILIAEDSPMLNKILVEALTQAGYTNLHMTTNGKEAYELLLEYKKTDIPIQNFVSLVISDIEMPQMDGHRLLKLMKEDEVLREVPLVFFSSLISTEMRRKGESLGAVSQLSKPEIVKLIEVVDEILSKL